MIWALVCLVSVTVLYYQWENWRGARELGAAWQRLVARVGTDDLLKLAPPCVPDEENFFALPVIEHWAVRSPESLSSSPIYKIPERALLPVGFISPKLAGNEDARRIDFEDWLAQYATFHQPVPAGATPAAAMDQALGDGNGLLPQLVAGLNRPCSQLKPAWRDAIVSVGNQPWQAWGPQFQNLLMEDLAIHHRAAAHNNHAIKVRDTALIMLRWSEAFLAHGDIRNAYLGWHQSQIAFDALQDSLSCSVWDARALARVQLELQKFDDLELLERVMCAHALVTAKAGAYVRKLQGEGRAPELLTMGIFSRSKNGPRRVDDVEWSDETSPMNGLYRWWLNHCPAGVHDGNAAFAIDLYLGFLGPKTSATWFDAQDRSMRTYRELKAQRSWYNPRRMWGSISVAQTSNMAVDVAQVLFRRRCLLIACALESYRLKHGHFPSSLEMLKRELAGFQVKDLVHPDQPMGYRLQEGGYLLWTGGEDGIDDGGLRDKDWLWRMKREGQN